MSKFNYEDYLDEDYDADATFVPLNKKRKEENWDNDRKKKQRPPREKDYEQF